MFQKFYSDTLGSRYIKSLLAQTPIPLYESVVDGDHLIAGCYYVYKRFIIQCVSSGILGVPESEILYPSNNLYPSIFLFPGTGMKGATFYVRQYVEDQTVKTHGVFKSSTNYYDSETHYHLGRYLRYLSTTKGINLMPYYNCFNYTYFTDIELYHQGNNVIGVQRVKNANYKMVAVPILFGRTYSIFLDSPTKVLMRAVIHDNTGFVDEATLVSNVSQDIYTTSLKATLEGSGKQYSYMSFNNPVNFRVETSTKSAVMLQHNMYLVIQLPLDNNSSIVVLENYIPKNGIQCNDRYVRKFTGSNLSLIKMNTRESYAFSDRLLEYLLGNVIDESDLKATNIATVQTVLADKFGSYKRAFIRGDYKKGVWDSNIPSLVQRILDDKGRNFVIYDQDGNINRDMEQLLYSKGGKYE